MNICKWYHVKWWRNFVRKLWEKFTWMGRHALQATHVISAFWKTHSCKLIINWTQNRMITYTNIDNFTRKCTLIDLVIGHFESSVFSNSDLPFQPFTIGFFALLFISPGSSKKPDSTVYQTPDWVFHHISSTRRKLKIPRLDWPFQGESWPLVRGFVWLPYGAVSCLCNQQELSYRRPGLCWPNIGLSA